MIKKRVLQQLILILLKTSEKNKIDQVMFLFCWRRQPTVLFIRRCQGLIMTWTMAFKRPKVRIYATSMLADKMNELKKSNPEDEIINISIITCFISDVTISKRTLDTSLSRRL